MTQNHFARKKRQLSVLAEELQYLLIYHKKDASTQIEKLAQKVKKLANELLHLISHTDLKKILGAAAIFIGISFSNQTNAQSFATPVSNPFGLDTTMYWALPAFADLDGDGDIDLLVGEYYGNIQYFENAGTATNPQFATPQVNPFGLDTINYIALPTCADLDGDGDLDILAGEEYGSMKYFENTGSETNPQFGAPQENPFGLISTYSFAAPAFADLDGDGDLDLLVGELYGALQYFENIGSATNPQFDAPHENPFGLDSTYVNAFPAFADLDDDGDTDLLVGYYYGDMKYFENVGSVTDPQFAVPLENPFGLIPTYYQAFPAFADLDDDGDMDLLVGEYYGAMQYFENTEIAGIPNQDLRSEIQLYPNPVQDILSIESSEKIERIEIINLIGDIIIIEENQTKEISLNNINPGIYTVKLTFENGNYAVQKIIKK